MGAAVRFKHVNVPRQQGEQARLKVVHGPDFGAVFVITGTRTTLGRGEENDIQVSDLKASRRHAEFTAIAGGWLVKDMGSANGLLHNGKNTREARIQTGDILTFGETTLEFVAAEAGTLMLVAPPRSADNAYAQQAALEEQKRRVRSFGAREPGAPANPADSRKTLIYLGLAGVLGYVLFIQQGEEKSLPKKKGAGYASTEDLSKFLPGNASDPSTERAADQFFKAGFREYTVGNYMRAKSQFETVLQMAPGHSLARMYVENCDLGIKNEVKFHVDEGKRAFASGKYKQAKAHYEAVLRILSRDSSNENYVEAKDQLESVLKALKGEKIEPPRAAKTGEGIN